MPLETLQMRGLIPSNAWGLVPTIAFAKYTEEDFHTMTMFCMDLSFQAQASRPKPAGQREGPKNRKDHFDTIGALCSFVIRLAFIDIHKSIGTRPKEWPPSLGLSSRLSFERVWVTQRFLCTPLGVVLDKTPRTSMRKFAIGHLTSSILNSSSLMLT